MDDSADRDVQRIAPETRLGLVGLGVQLVIIGLPLVLLTGRTETYFSWTIDPPLTAATLGACYWGSSVLVLLAARQPAWAFARVVLPGIVVAGCMLLLATFLHIDRFHMDSVTGWVWLVLYALLPLAVLVLVLRQRRAPGRDPSRKSPMPAWAVWALGAEAGVLLATGVVLFAVPEDTASLWPWTLSPLTARAIGAWLLAIGASAAYAAWEADWQRIRVGMVGYAAIALLALVALARFADTPDWGAPSAWILVLFLATMFATGLWAAVAAGRGPVSAR